MQDCHWSANCGLLPVKYLAKKIIVAVDYCGSQIAQRVGLVGRAYLKKVQYLILECTGVAGNMTGDMVGTLRCGL